MTNEQDSINVQGLQLNVWYDEEDGGQLHIEWDEEDPRAQKLGINDWTEDQWVMALNQFAESQEASEDL